MLHLQNWAQTSENALPTVVLLIFSPSDYTLHYIYIAPTAVHPTGSPIQATALFALGVFFFGLDVLSIIVLSSSIQENISRTA